MEKTNDDILRDSNQLAEDFYSGACVLQFLSGWGRVIADPDGIHEMAVKFERAYTEINRLQNEGNTYNHPAFASIETIEAVRRINELIKLGLDSPETRRHAAEIYALAELCLETLKSDSTPKSDDAPDANNEPT
jgi:hypothetical protein